MSTRVTPPPGLSPMPPGLVTGKEESPRGRSRSRNTDISTGNPKFRSGSRTSDNINQNQVPIGEVFKRKSRNFMPKPPAFRKADGGEEGKKKPRPPSKDFEDEMLEKAYGKGRKEPRPPAEDKFEALEKKPSLSRRHVFSFGLGAKGDENFDPHDLQEIDYDEEFKRIDSLPFRERMLAKKIPGRVGMALMAICMLWFTSLGFIKFIMEDLIFPSPTFTEVKNESEIYFDFVTEQRDVFERCASALFDTCENDFNNANSAEFDSKTANAAANEADLEAYETARFNSKAALTTALELVIDFVEAGNLLANALNNGVSLTSCPTVRRLVQEQVATVAAQSSFADFDIQSTAAIDGLVQQLRDQDSFTTNFWATKEIELAALNTELAEDYARRSAEILDGLTASLGNLKGCTNNDCGVGDSLGGLLNRSLDLIDADFFNMQSGKNDSDVNTDAFIAKYDSLLTAIQNFNANSLIKVPLTNTAPVQAPDISFDGLLENNEAAQKIRDSAAGAFDAAESSLNGASSSAGSSATNFANGLDDFSLGGIEPYNPPPVDEGPANDYKAAQAQRNTDFENSLNGISQSQNGNDDDFVPPKKKQTNFEEILDSPVSEFPGRDFDFFSYPETVFNDIEASFNLAVELAIWADVIFRIAQTLLIINKYWNISKIGKPPGDARVPEAHGQKSGQKATSTEKMAARLASPLVVNAIALVFVLVLVILGWWIYEPFYSAFEDGCVDHDSSEIPGESNGTMIFRNMAEVAFNFIVEKGDTVASISVDELNVRRETECQQNFQTTAETFDNQVNLFTAILEDYTKTLNIRAEMLLCLDLPDIDAVVGNGANPTPVANLLADESFNEDMQPMRDGVYNCSVIPLCSVLCEPISDVVFKSATHDTACSAELFLHATILATIMTIITFILMYMMRKMFMNAMVRLFWRELNPYDFSVLASCTRAGQHLDRPNVTENGDSLQDTIAMAVHEALIKWEKESMWLLIGAASLNLPWIFGAAFLSAGLGYDF